MQIFLIFLQLIVLITTSSGLNYKTGTNVNRHHLKQIEGTMDPTTDPCENFYQYACGNWDKVHTDISKYHGHYSRIEYNNNIEMAKLLAIMGTREPTFVTTARTYYRSCVAFKKLNLMEYLKWLEENEHINMMLTETKAINSSIELDWLKHLAIMNKYGLRGIFQEEVYIKSRTKLKLNKPLKDKGFKSLTFNEFKILKLRTFFWTHTMGFHINWSELSTFENDLLKLLDSSKGSSQSFTMANLQELPWLYRYVNMLLNNTRFPHKTIDLKIVIEDMDYVTQLYEFLQSYNQQFLCEYLKIKFLWHLLLTSYRINITPEACALMARKYMYLAMDYLFEQQHVDLVESIPKIKSMFLNIKNHYAKVLLANPNGFNSTVMKFLLNKVNSTKLKVGLLPRNNTQQTLETLYSNLQLNEGASESFYGNQMQMLKFKANATLLMRLQDAGSSNYFEHTKRESPYYLRHVNTVVLPITTLQLPIYDSNLADILIYSSLGYILGHEITHGFDTAGIKRDRNGRLMYLFHKIITANPKFQENLRCLRRLNNSEIDEKIADVTGFRVAFQTYFELNPKTRHNPVYINGKNLTLDKVFFLNYGQYRCSTSKEAPFEDLIHGTHEDRIVDALSHFPEFVKTFECSPYADMHLEKSCQLWRK